MAITYPLAMPSSPSFRQIELSMTNIVGGYPCEFTGQQTVQLWPGEYWSAKCAVACGKRDVMAAWVAWLAALRGIYGIFPLGDPAGAIPRGVATGTPLVNGAGQIGLTLAMKGFTPNITAILKANDYIQVGSGITQRLYMNLKDVNSDGSGQVNADIWPRLRESPADNAPITLVNAMGTFRLAGNVRTFGYDATKIYTVSFDAIEAI